MAAAISRDTPMTHARRYLRCEPLPSLRNTFLNHLSLFCPGGSDVFRVTGPGNTALFMVLFLQRFYGVRICSESLDIP
jgi:hypothetical protein